MFIDGGLSLLRLVWWLRFVLYYGLHCWWLCVSATNPENS